jgi:hypothetical protein
MSGCNSFFPGASPAARHNSAVTASTQARSRSGLLRYFRRFLTGLLLPAVLSGICGCTRKEAPQVQNKTLRPTLMIQTGAAPLWVEFEGGTLRPIASPEAAALKPFDPWPLAEYAAGMVQWEDGLAVAVNRRGFWLVKEVENGLLELFFLPETEFAPLYTMLKAFTFQDRPAFLLYRDDFFVERDIPPPYSKVFAVKDDISGLEVVEIPAFSGFPGAEGWDIEDFFADGDGALYFKAIQKAVGSVKIIYIRAETLYVNGEGITLDAYMRAAKMAAAERQDGASGLPAGLPPLPENFIYTTYSQVRGTGLAAWEERESWNIGAVGLLFLRLDSAGAPQP